MTTDGVLILALLLVWILIAGFALTGQRQDIRGLRERYEMLERQMPAPQRPLHVEPKYEDQA
jgi:hypothetical protein